MKSSIEHEYIVQINNQIAENRESKILKNDDFGAYGSPLGDYDVDFKSVLRPKKIVDLVKRKSSPVVIDFMGPSDTLASLFGKIIDKPKLGIAVSYCDKRSNRQLARDEELGIKQIAGDILELTTWKKIEETLDGRKADLIMERAVIGKDYLTSDIRVHAILLNKAWKLCANFGMMLIDLPRYGGRISINGKKRNFSEWISLVKDAGIDVNYSRKWNVLKFVKTPNSPQNLPFLQ